MKLNQMTGRQRTAILVGTLAILAVCVLAAGSILILSAKEPRTHNGYLETAKKYADADDYDEAVSTYWMAIRSNQYDTRSYAALGRLYLENDDMESAIEVLEMGERQTGSQELTEQRKEAEAQQAEEETQLAETQDSVSQNTSDYAGSTGTAQNTSAGANTNDTASSSSNSSANSSNSNTQSGGSTSNDETDNAASSRKGSNASQNEEKEELDEYDSKKPGALLSDDSDDESATEEITLNTELLNDFRTYTYADFEENYGEAELGSTSDGLLAVTFEGFEGTAYFDTDGDNEPDKKDMPKKIELDQLGLLFQGMEDSLTLEQLRATDEALEDAETGRENGRTVVEFITCGCAVFLEADDEGMVERDAWNSITSLDRAENITDEEPDEDEESGSAADSRKRSDKDDEADEDDEDADTDDEKVCTLEGTLTDKRTDGGIEDAGLTLYKGSGSGKKLAECETDEDGDYSFEELAEGKYTLKIEAEGYQDKTVTVELEDEETMKDIELSPHEIRIELSWKEDTQNLDAHLDGETEDGEEIAISPANREAKENGEILAALDKDVRDGKGTETITLYALDGEYTYTVKEKTGKLNKSEAVVKLYYDDRLEEEYTVPASAKNEWEVFTLEDGEPKECED